MELGIGGKVALVAASGRGLGPAVAIRQCLVNHVRDVLGPVAILMTNSGGPPPGTFEDAGDAAWEWITVDSVLPGPTATERQVELIASRARRSGISEAESRAQIVRDIPVGRLAELVDGGAVRAL